MRSIELQREAVLKEAQSWLGTPFRDCARVKGPRGGVDCGQFLCCVYASAGVATIAEPPRYNLQFMLNRIEESYIEELLKYTREIRQEEAVAADVVVLRWGHVYSHGAILLDRWPGPIVHALNPLGVVFNDAQRDARIIASLRKYRNYPPRFFRPKAWV